MIKGMKKITTLVAVAATVTTIMPLRSAYAVEALESIEGTMDKVYTYKNGTYLFEGYRDENTSSGVYYFDGENDIKIEDAERDGIRFGDKYVSFEDDEVLFNLETGKVEEEIEEDRFAVMETKFKSKIKKAEKYGEDYALGDGTKLSSDSWSSQWYEYRVSNGKKKFLTYLSDDGLHLDASEVAGMIHYAKDENGDYVQNENGKIEKIQLNKSKDLSTKGYKISEQQTVYADSKYIYRIVTIVSADEEKSYDTNTYLQLISKEQGKMKKGVYQPKSAISYEIDTEDFDYIIDSLSRENNIISFKENILYVANLDGETLNVDKFELDKTKEDKLDKRKVEIDDDFEIDDVTDITKDSSENIWIISKGKIKKLVNGDFETIYTVDRSLDKLSVYSENNLAAWSTDTGIYVSVNKNEAVEEKKIEEKLDIQTASTTSAAVSVNTDMSKNSINNGWIKEGENWYYLNNDGTMKKGWLKDNNAWYYLQEDGSMKTGWFKDIDETWYYLKQNGSMAANETIDGYNLGENGAWIK